MAYDAGLATRMSDTLDAIGERGIRQKNVFGGRGFLIGKATFAIASSNAMLVKVPSSEYAALLDQQGVTAFAPGGERPMGTWLVVATDVIAEDPDLADWLRRGLRALR